MSSRLRASLAAAAFAIAVLGAVAFVAHMNATSGDSIAAGNGPLAAVDLRSLLQNPAQRDQRMLDTTFRRVETRYTRPVNPQSSSTASVKRSSIFYGSITSKMRT